MSIKQFTISEFCCNLNMKVGEKMKNRIAELRKRKSLTLKELGNKISMRDNTLSQYETGKREPKIETWNKLANYFNVPIAYLQGSGWSQNEVVQFLLLILINSFGNREFQSFSKDYIVPNDIEKYGFDKASLEDLENEDLQGFYEKAKDYLYTYKSSEIESFSDFEDGMSINEYIDDYFYELCEKLLNAEDIDAIRTEIIDSISNKSIDLSDVLSHLLPDEITKSFNHLSISLNVDNVRFESVDDIPKKLNSKELKNYSDFLLDNIKALKNYSFLASIGENTYTTGITPEYEIAKELQRELKLKDFQNVQDYISANPYKASEELINSLNLSSKDKKILKNLITFLINENGNLKDELENLSNRVEELENSDHFNEFSNR